SATAHSSSAVSGRGAFARSCARPSRRSSRSSSTATRTSASSSRAAEGLSNKCSISQCVRAPTIEDAAEHLQVRVVGAWQALKDALAPPKMSIVRSVWKRHKSKVFPQTIAHWIVDLSPARLEPLLVDCFHLPALDETGDGRIAEKSEII